MGGEGSRETSVNLSSSENEWSVSDYRLKRNCPWTLWSSWKWDVKFPGVSWKGGDSLLTFLLPYWAQWGTMSSRNPHLGQGGRQGWGQKKLLSCDCGATILAELTRSDKDISALLNPLLFWMLQRNLIPTNIDFTCIFSSLPFIFHQSLNPSQSEGT